MSSDWVMVVITGIYVIATIFISCANIRSAKASKMQLQVMQQQYADENRPIIEVEFHYTKRTWYFIRFKNNGRKTAQHVKIILDQCFIDSLPEEKIRRELEHVKGKECIIGVNQHYDLFIGSNELRDNPQMKPVTGTIEYKYQGLTYRSDIFIDLEHYMTFYSVKTDEEEMLEAIKNISKELKGVEQILNNTEV